MGQSASIVDKEEPEFKVDLRIEGIAQVVILEDEERMGQVRKVVDTLRTGYHTTSIIEDLGKTGKSIKFSEESSRTIHELGNENLGCTQRECMPNEIIINDYRKMFESRISAE